MSEPKFKPGDRVRVVRKNPNCETPLEIGAEVIVGEYYGTTGAGFPAYCTDPSIGGFDESEVELISTAEQTEEATSMTKQVELKDEYRIKTESPLERRMVLAALMEAGFVWHRNIEKYEDPAEVELMYPFMSYPIVIIKASERNVGGAYGNMAEDTLSDVLKAIAPAPPKPIEIKLNSNHTATVTSSEVKVGCQTFSFAVIEQLAEAVAKMKGAAA